MDWHTEVEEETKEEVQEDSEKETSPKEEAPLVEEEVEGVDEASEIPEGQESKYGL